MYKTLLNKYVICFVIDLKIATHTVGSIIWTKRFQYKMTTIHSTESINTWLAHRKIHTSLRKIQSTPFPFANLRCIFCNFLLIKVLFFLSFYILCWRYYHFYMSCCCIYLMQWVLKHLFGICASIHLYKTVWVHVKSKNVKYNKKGNPYSDFTLFSSTPFICSAFNVSTFTLSNIQTQSNILY